MGDKVTYDNLTIVDLIDLVDGHYFRNGFTDASVQTIMVGIMEEVGELAEQVLLQHSPDYKPRQNKQLVPLREEIADVMVYCLAMCLKLGTTPLFRNMHDS